MAVFIENFKDVIKLRIIIESGLCKLAKQHIVAHHFIDNSEYYLM